jgi:hypothetical protein
MTRKFSYRTDLKNYFLLMIKTNIFNMFLNNILYCLEIMFDKLQVFNVESEQLYKLFII